MTKDVLISIKGNHDYGDSEEPIEIMTRGECVGDDGAFYISYDEMLDDGGIIKNRIVISDGEILMEKHGFAEVVMKFREGESSVSEYATEYGDFVIGFDTRRVKKSVTQELIETEIEYEIAINGEPASRCCLNISIRPA